MTTLPSLDKYALTDTASDLTLSAGTPLVARIEGDVHFREIVSADEYAGLYDILGKPKPLDVGSFTYEGRRFRSIYYKAEAGEYIELRVLPKVIPKLETLGVPPEFTRLLKAGRGLVVVTGCTGSGKTTTLAASVDHINETSDSGLKIITLEDPIEYIHSNKKCLVNQLQLHRDFPSFAVAGYAGLRQDPDIFMVGELRDPATFAAALTLAETGHLVFGTMHTRDAAGSVSRIIDATASDTDALSSFSASLVGILAQQLVKGIDGRRVAAFELLVPNAGTRNNIRDKQISHIRHGIAQTPGMIAMDDSLLALYRQKKITRETALSHAFDPIKLEKKS
jgi:twitching motility protein PilT